MEKKSEYVGIDLFAGAGGLSLGAEWAGVDVALAIEKDKAAAETYKHNHPDAKVIIDDICNVHAFPTIDCQNKKRILFGGPPCQGFSYSNQRTRNEQNPNNWLLMEFMRLVSLWEPDCVVFENVYGFVETRKGLFLNTLVDMFEKIKYKCAWFILNAMEYGVPQRRSRFFLIATKSGKRLSCPDPSGDTVTVGQAIDDLPSLKAGASENYLEYKTGPANNFAKSLRGDLPGCTGHLVSRNADYVLNRYEHVPKGGNWRNIPESLMGNYKDRLRCHTGIYHRLDPDQTALTIGNYRKAMLIHPWEHRGLSVREAARIQSFPDYYQFRGSIGFQQQQVGNAVPPLLAKHVFNKIIENI